MLPQGKPGSPAALPQEVLQWEQRNSGRIPAPAPRSLEPRDDDMVREGEGDGHGEEAACYGLDDEYSYTFADGKSTLQHTASGHQLELDGLPHKGPYKFYRSDEGHFCIYGTTPEYCCDVFTAAQAAENEYKQRQSRNATAPRVLTGMLKETPGAPKPGHKGEDTETQRQQALQEPAPMHVQGFLCVLLVTAKCFVLDRTETTRTPGPTRSKIPKGMLTFRSFRSQPGLSSMSPGDSSCW